MRHVAALVGAVAVATASAPCHRPTGCNVTLYPDQNDLAASVDDPQQSTKDVIYLGDFASTRECQEACVANPSCNSFKYHKPAFGAPWAKGCYGRVGDWSWDLTPWKDIDSGRVGTPPPPTPSPPHHCSDDFGCNLNGACRRGACSCYAGWAGGDCGTLDLLPAAKGAAPAYGRAPSDSRPGIASWGGSVVKDPERELYHMYVSEIQLECGLNAWFRNSAIVHATSADPAGPYERKEEVLPYFAHEPVVATVPEAAGGGYLLYKIGCADGAVTGSRGTGLKGPCTGCSNGVTKGNCPGCSQEYEQACQEVLYSKSLDGPWARHNLTMDGWDWTRQNLGLESHTPVLFDNGTVLTFTRAWAAPAPLPVSSLWVVRADRWDGRYALARDAPVFDFPVEDSYMWRDPRGNFHAFFHTMGSCASSCVGGHAYSADGLDWRFASTTAFGVDVAAEGGGATTYARRERPHLLLDADGNPSHLFTGVTLRPQDAAGGDWSFTHVQAVRR